jgi:hypothetical protein
VYNILKNTSPIDENHLFEDAKKLKKASMGIMSLKAH